jgi:hypothetical protein
MPIWSRPYDIEDAMRRDTAAPSFLELGVSFFFFYRGDYTMFESECPLVAHNIKLYTTTCTNSDSNYICRFVGLQRLGPLFSLRFLPSELFKSKICLSEIEDDFTNLLH